MDTTYELVGKNIESIAKAMTSEDIAEAQQLARAWKPKTGNQ